MTTTTEQKSTKQLFAELLDGIRNLARERVHEASVEREEEIKMLRRAPILMGIAGGITLVGAVLAGHTLALVLDAVGLPAWAAYAIIAAIMIGVGILLLRRTPKPGEIDTVPESALKRIGDDIKEIAKEVAHDVKEPGHAITTHGELPRGVRR